uniref:F5/8 type C domain-containing protein n=1 Tax=Chromera velia CCMP2878 TaxID=1169474 RepID=A0A0G4HQJ3_9ALVE|eukprot:Cvel_7939.t1-p1 / transcript=Cvel_7939.t1 / gene=Cvel_7939 / organism=Chromera_velia_CCMP2878 / gene_product=hypothetical protein / transcript_product=hypothetical protein / location=Cvel_scaffold426:39283-43235(-) / protein_length=457 / sequence_SO=supercontig / SO=protein_coding / is_pseudo=false
MPSGTPSSKVRKRWGQISGEDTSLIAAMMRKSEDSSWKAAARCQQKNIRRPKQTRDRFSSWSLLKFILSLLLPILLPFGALETLVHFARALTQIPPADIGGSNTWTDDPSVTYNGLNTQYTDYTGSVCPGRFRSMANAAAASWGPSAAFDRTGISYQTSTAQAGSGQSSGSESNVELILQIPCIIALSSYKVTARAESSNTPSKTPSKLVVYGSTDGSVWTEIGSFEGETSWTVSEVKTFSANSTSGFNYFKFDTRKIAGSDDSQVTFADIELLGTIREGLKGLEYFDFGGPGLSADTCRAKVPRWLSAKLYIRARQREVFAQRCLLALSLFLLLVLVLLFVTIGYSSERFSPDTRVLFTLRHKQFVLREYLVCNLLICCFSVGMPVSWGFLQAFIVWMSCRVSAFDRLVNAFPSIVSFPELARARHVSPGTDVVKNLDGAPTADWVVPRPASVRTG